MEDISYINIAVILAKFVGGWLFFTIVATAVTSKLTANTDFHNLGISIAVAIMLIFIIQL